MRRALIDIASQTAPFAITLLDRLVLTALLLRLWGVDIFEQWSVLVSVTTILSIADMGCQISFSNKMAAAAHGGAPADAARIFRESNAIFLGIALFVSLLTLLLSLVDPVQRLAGLPAPLSLDQDLALLALGLAAAVRMAMSNQLGVYRANLAFGRGTVLASLIELARILGVAAAAVAGLGVGAAAWGLAIATFLGTLVLIPMDIARRFPAYRYRVALPTRFTTQGQLRLGFLFSLPFIPMIVLVHLPVMIIGTGGRAEVGVLAAFVLMRTLSNFMRTFILKVLSVLGMELARLGSQQRGELVDASYRLLSRLTACGFGFMSAALLGFGPELLYIWVGDASLFDPLLLAIMLLPLVALPTAQIAWALLVYDNRPAPVATAVVAQAVAALLIALFLPVEDIALRLTIAIFATEVLPMGPILIRAARGSLRLRVLADEALSSALAVGSCAATYLAIITVKPWLPNLTSVIAAGAVLTLIFALLLAASFHKPFKRWRASQ